MLPCWRKRRQEDVPSDEEESSTDSEDDDDFSGTHYTPVPEGLFGTPQPTGRSGGTAAFFCVRYTGPPGALKDRWGRTDEYWLGKDLERAADELGFYEQISALGPKYQLLHRWAMEYGGVLTARCACVEGGTTEHDPRRLVLLRNMRDGVRQLRMLDIKVGSRTAVPGWQGKSSSAAARQTMVDLLTNSAVQGFRVEGFDNPPEALSSQLEGEPNTCPCLKVGKKHKRFAMQRLDAPEFLLHWIDFSGLQPMERHQGALLPVEYSEALLFDAVGQLACLCLDARRMPVPQMWIGSSIALCCEGGVLPKRTQALQSLSSLLGALAQFSSPSASSSTPAPAGGLAQVKVFDWGRSELNTEEHHAGLAGDHKTMRETYWAIWQRGTLRLMFAAMCLYCSQFTTLGGSEAGSVEIRVWDWDTYDPSDLIGTVTIPLQPTVGPLVLQLQNAPRGCCATRRHKPAITVEVRASQPPPDSRLSQIWHVHIVAVHDLPRMDLFSDSDPTVEVLLGPVELGDRRSKARTRVVYNDNDAAFNARLDFGVSRPEVVDSLFRSATAVFGETVDQSSLWANPQEKEAEAFDHFVKGLGDFAALGDPRRLGAPTNFIRLATLRTWEAVSRAASSPRSASAAAD